MSLLAIDLGGSSGKISRGRFDGARLSVEEVHRFPNDPVWVGDRFHWDILRIYHEIKQGFRAAAAKGAVESFGIDSWGLDFGLLDAAGELIGNPGHYRDPRNISAMDRVLARVSREEIFARTGAQFHPVNTLYQLEALRGSPALERARTLLQIPDLLRFFLTGERSSEYTIATTTQCIAIATGDWDRDLLDLLDLPVEILQPLVRGPLDAGALRPSVRAELDLPAVRAVVVGQHDTASAVAATPAQGDFAYVSCGTWALLGTEVTDPVVTAETLAWNFTNEGGLLGTYRLLKNIMGLWLVESCRRAWTVGGEAPSFERMRAELLAAPAFGALIDPDAIAFLNPVSMPAAIQGWCEANGQPAPGDRGAILRAIHEGLALKFRHVLERTERLAGRRFGGLHLVGGGARNDTLCQFTANAIGRPVWAGPVEATTIGNLIAQLMAAGAVAGLDEARALVRASFPVVTYEPRDTAAWNEAYGRFEAMLARPGHA